ncbi:unnamed protein product [Periconia digitata]|uniref:Uncharacterized protein n=1 Tax=Periconia digitata TaxID=1303443 RepID=A0A9W4XUD5_9PLEO|nr:unnamed protein product [Periconia digitata]
MGKACFSSIECANRTRILQDWDMHMHVHVQSIIVTVLPKQLIHHTQARVHMCMHVYVYPASNTCSITIEPILRTRMPEVAIRSSIAVGSITIIEVSTSMMYMAQTWHLARALLSPPPAPPLTPM